MGKNMEAPISTDDLRKLLLEVTPGDWRREAMGGMSTVLSNRQPSRNDRRADASYAYRGDEFCIAYPFIEDDGKSFRTDFVCFDHGDARLIALTPQLAAEVLARRADLAAPSAPAEVDGLVERLREEAMTDRTLRISARMAEEIQQWASDELSQWPRETGYAADLESLLAQLTAEQPATALTELQAEITKMRKADEILQGLYEIEKDRAENAEAVADQLADALHHMVNASLHPDQFADDAIAAHAKLKGDV